jgi:uncharacterized membrane protein
MSHFWKQIAEIRERLLTLPALFSAVAAVAAGVFVWLDRRIATEDLPVVLQTSVDGGREVLGTVSMGLITAFTLLLSLVLIAVQLASSQFSPRTLRNWLGDHTLQRAIGLVLATVVFSLLVLYQTRDLDDVDTFEPNLSVLVSIVLALVSLVVVLRSVDHLGDSMRVGSVAKQVMTETLDLIERIDKQHDALDRPTINPAPQLVPALPKQPPGGVHIVESESAGWIQEIDVDAVFDACPEGSTVHLPVAVGAFALLGMPIAWVSPLPDDPDELEGFDRKVRWAISIGNIRTMRQDLGLGITRLVDIALRALSPSLNDANTAKDVIAHLGQILLALLKQPERSGSVTRDGRTVATVAQSHRQYVLAAFDQIRHSAAENPQVIAVLVQTVLTVRHELARRTSLPGVPVLDEFLTEVMSDLRRSSLSGIERQRIIELVPADLRSLIT